MNRQQIISSLNKIANVLDEKSFYNEANSLTYIMTKIANVSDESANNKEFDYSHLRRNPLQIGFNEEYDKYRPLTNKAKTLEQAEKQEQKYHKTLISLLNLYKNYVDEETYNEIYSKYYSDSDIPGYKKGWGVEKYFWRDIRKIILENIIQSRKDKINNINRNLEEKFENIKKIEMEKLRKEYNTKIYKNQNISGTKNKVNLNNLDAAIEHYGLLFEYANQRTNQFKNNTSLQPTQQDFQENIQENNENLDLSNDVQK